MSTEAKEVVYELKTTKCIPAPSQRRRNPTGGPTDQTPSVDATSSTTKKKPTPNYLRPTIISSHKNASRLPQSPSPTPRSDAAAKKPIEKTSSHSSSSSQLPKDKTRAIRSSLLKTTNSSLKVRANSKSISKETTAPAKRKDAKAQAQAQAQAQEEMVSSISKRGEEEEEVMADSSNNNEAEGGKIEEGKEGAKEKKYSPRANSLAMEEAASELAEKRNKVKALVGAFETVISLQEPEKTRSPQKRGSDPHCEHKEEEKAEEGESGQLSRREETGDEHVQHNTGREQEASPEDKELTESMGT